ncbi:MAG: YhbY family RNA-binding protein [Verrucomicrobiota bacterium]
MKSVERKQLKAKAHHLRPIIRIGKAGVTDSLIQQIDRVLKDHQLIKLQFDAHKERRKELSLEITSKSGAEIVSLVGHVLTIYKE